MFKFQLYVLDADWWVYIELEADHVSGLMLSINISEFKGSIVSWAMWRDEMVLLVNIEFVFPSGFWEDN